MANTLPTAVLGRTGVKVTRLGYGAMELRGDMSRGRTVTEERAEKVLNTLLDEGVNFIDTADCYGRSEEFIGRFLSRRRSEFTLATKCGCTPEGPKLWTRDNLFVGLHRSLKRLNADHIDVMQLHGANPQQCEEGGLVDALNEMKAQGKVRWIGASTTTPNIEVFAGWGVFDEFQIPYSAFYRATEGTISVAAKAGMGTVIRGGVAKGAPGAGLGKEDAWKLFSDAGLGELEAPGETPTAFMLRFTMSHPDVNTIIVGTQNPDHLRENVRTAKKGPLEPSVYVEAKRRLDAVKKDVQ
ncbi:MAG: aldo/keto reductase [SAR202 cluster bacterium]|nr:aldo/keto reductase [SAR202 cluster bacterium]